MTNDERTEIENFLVIERRRTNEGPLRMETPDGRLVEITRENLEDAFPELRRNEDGSRNFNTFWNFELERWNGRERTVRDPSPTLFHVHNGQRITGARGANQTRQNMQNMLSGQRRNREEDEPEAPRNVRQRVMSLEDILN
jgi:hypothetical protein